MIFWYLFSRLVVVGFLVLPTMYIIEYLLKLRLRNIRHCVVENEQFLLPLTGYHLVCCILSYIGALTTAFVCNGFYLQMDENCFNIMRYFFLTMWLCIYTPFLYVILKGFALFEEDLVVVHVYSLLSSILISSTVLPFLLFSGIVIK